MIARRALLKKLASVTDWDTARRAALEGESWLETRNTLYRFRDGVCFAVACRDRRKNARGAAVLVGMRLVGWLTGDGGRARLSYAWEAGACAVLWRPGTSETDGPHGRDARDGTGSTSDEAMALTSPTTAFTRGKSPAYLQALHDTAPPDDSSLFRREGEPGVAVAPLRARLPSSQSHSS